MPLSKMDETCINTIRTLSMDAVQAANSGHPGTAMAMAPVVYTLWQKYLRFDPADPIWPNRDRFVLSIGHASMLLYSTLHLTGVKSVNEDYESLGEPSVPLDSIKKFRQLDSKCPGHPEYRWTSGVETTTGPLGQGVATSVGMAIGGNWLAAHYNKPGFELFDFNVFALCGDGDMMEGISSEAASLAGHLKLPNLCWIYDSNRITIDGSTEITFTEDTAARFRAYGWNVIEIKDANDTDALAAAFDTFKKTTDRPTFILVHSHIAFGSSMQDKAKAHGSPLGDDVIADWKQKFGCPPEKFAVPEGVYEHFQQGVGKRGKELRDAWFAKIGDYKKAFPAEADALERMQHRRLPDGWDKDLPTFPADAKGIAGRSASSKVLNAVAMTVPWLVGGAADLNESTKTEIGAEGAGSFEPGSYGGRNLHFGIREHVMAAVLNGLSLIKLRPFGSGFLIFSDYAKPAIRISAIMEVPTIHVFTHDSIGVGEDGPTHQPIEQLPTLRAVPHLLTIRPGDANEIVEAWRLIMNQSRHPSCLILTRQDVPTLDRTVYRPAAGLHKGAYILADAPDGKPDVILMASGSEVPLCASAFEKLKAEGVSARVVSMPCWELFEQQADAYKAEVLPPGVKARVYVEQASTFGWDRYTGTEGAKIGMSAFGASAPLKELQKKFGFTVEAVVAKAKEQIAHHSGQATAGDSSAAHNQPLNHGKPHSAN